MAVNNTLDNHKTTVGDSICNFHRKYPLEKYEGCACSPHYKLMRKEVQDMQIKRRSPK